jgi:hypothetical protein
MRIVAVIGVATALTSGIAHGQFPPQRATNLKVLPSSITMDDLVDTMAGFTRALGVRCNYCHVGADGAAYAAHHRHVRDLPPWRRAAATPPAAAPRGL